MNNMKKTKKKLSILLAVGLLLMNGLAFTNLLYITHINIDVIDFMRGMGLPLIFWSSYNIINIMAENRRKNNYNQ
jgi:hypothetical protein